MIKYYNNVDDDDGDDDDDDKVNMDNRDDIHVNMIIMMI
jgi:hypothetical protein